MVIGNSSRGFKDLIFCGFSLDYISQIQYILITNSFDFVCCFFFFSINLIYFTELSENEKCLCTFKYYNLLPTTTNKPIPIKLHTIVTGKMMKFLIGFNLHSSEICLQFDRSASVVRK